MKEETRLKIIKYLRNEKYPVSLDIPTVEGIKLILTALLEEQGV